MDERKRSANYDNDDIAPPLKRQATGANGAVKRDPDVDTTRDPELEEFQKEAALRQMNEYKRAKRTIEKEFDDLQKKSAAHDDHIRAIDAWFAQLLDEIRISAGQFQQDGFSFSVFPSSLLSTDLTAFDSFLQKRAGDMVEAMKAIFVKGHDREPSITEMQGEVARLIAAAKRQANELEKNRLEKEQIEERLETASMRYMVAEKKLDRVKSQTVQKLEKQMLVTQMDVPKSASNEKTENPDTVSSQALQDAEIALQAALAESAKQAEQLQELVAHKQTLTSQLTDIKLKTTQPSDDDFAQTELFKQLKKQLEDFINRVNGLEASNNELRRETKRLQEERAAYRTEVDAELHASTSEQQQHLSKVEADLARIRTARDELEAEKGIRETTFRTDKKALEQLREVLGAKDEQIKALELHKSESGGLQADATPEIQSLSIEELREKLAKSETQLKMWKQESEAMSAAYKKLTASVSTKYNNQLEMEDKLQRMSAEKAKADQKYFSAMKSKDTFAAEVKTLRAQNAKSSEMIASFKDLEAASRQQLTNLEKQIAEAKQAFSILENKHYVVQNQVMERSAQLDTLNKQVQDLKAIATSKDSENATTASQLRKSEINVEKLKATLAEKEKYFETFKKMAVPTGSDSVVLEQLRQMTTCNICRINFKDRTIQICGHTFCKECLETRLKSRMRKCPHCGVGFGETDVKAITL